MSILPTPLRSSWFRRKALVMRKICMCAAHTIATYHRIGVRPSATAPPDCPLAGSRQSPLTEQGFSLIEAVVATVIAALAVVGLAHTFGLGRAFINRFE